MTSPESLDITTFVPLPPGWTMRQLRNWSDAPVEARRAADAIVADRPDLELASPFAYRSAEEEVEIAGQKTLGVTYYWRTRPRTKP